MGKRKKKVSTRKTVASKKNKSEEEQPSTSKEEEGATVPEDVLPTVEEKVDPEDEQISTETPTISDELPSVQSDEIVTLSENVIANDENLAPGSPGEFIFAPIISNSGEGSSTVDLRSRTSSENSNPSTSASDQVVTLLTSIVGEHAKKQNLGDSSSATNDPSRTEPSTIEIIDVDELPDTPCSSIGDDVIEITPSNSNHSSRSNSPEVILNRHVVDLTGSVEVERTFSDTVAGTEEEADDDGDVFLSLWASMHREKQKAKPILVPSSSNKESTTASTDEAESSSCTKLHCPICMDDFTQIAKDRRLMSTSCGHVFCDVCVKAAVETQKRCPTCRKKQTMKNLHPIFL